MLYEKKWKYTPVIFQNITQLPALFKGITSKHGGNFYCLNCLHSFRTENKFKSHVLEFLTKKIDEFADNKEKSSTTEVGEHTPCGYSMSTIWAFDNIENKRSLLRGEGCMKKFCSVIREHATNVINFEKKKMLALTKKELKLHQHATACYI